MERVKKGEKYWGIEIFTNIIKTVQYTDINGYYDNETYNVGNYFTTREEAEAMANKLRAVLNGADVIQMPSEKEIKKVADERAGKSICPYFQYSESNVIGNRYASFIEGVNWLKSKIVN